MDILIKTKPDAPVYLFMGKKRMQGKPYYVYMTVGANKFLRIYYGRAEEYLSSLPQWPLLTYPHFRPAITGGLFLVF